jgi:hypothetical protein
MKVPRAKYGRAIAIAVWTILLTGTAAIVLDLPIVGAIRGSFSLPEPPGAGLELRDVSVHPIGGASTVVVEGTVVNVSGRNRELPRFHAVARGAGRTDLKDWRMSLPTRVLLPGESIAFRFEFADMPRDAQDLALTFEDR